MNLLMSNEFVVRIESKVEDYIDAICDGEADSKQGRAQAHETMPYVGQARVWRCGGAKARTDLR